LRSDFLPGFGPLSARSRFLVRKRSAPQVFGPPQVSFLENRLSTRFLLKAKTAISVYYLDAASINFGKTQPALQLGCSVSDTASTSHKLVCLKQLNRQVSLPHNFSFARFPRGRAPWSDFHCPVSFLLPVLFLVCIGTRWLCGTEVRILLSSFVLVLLCLCRRLLIGLCIGGVQ
jgi:hypothetical protein